MIAWIDHLTELRKRLLRLLVLFTILFLIALYFAKPLFDFFTYPLIHVLPSDSHMIATQMATPLLVPIKTAFYATALISMPLWLYQLWLFIAPALYPQERKLLRFLFLLSCFLFFAGGSFAYYVACPLIFKFFISALPSHVNLMPDIYAYFSFTTQLIFAFAFCFETPLVIFLLYYFGIITDENTKKIRPYVIVSAFILGMLLTPPDVISQILLAIPLWLFFELGIVLAKWIRPFQTKMPQK